MKSFNIDCFIGEDVTFKSYLCNWLENNTYKYLNMDEINLLKNDYKNISHLFISQSNNCYIYKIIYRNKDDFLANNQVDILVSNIQEFQKALLYRELGIHPKDDPNFYGEGDERNSD